MVFITAYSKISPVLILLIIGIVLRRTSFISEGTISELKKLVISISLPALLFFSFLNTDFRLEYLILIITIFFVNLALLVIGFGVKRLVKETNKYFPLLFTGFEMGMLGFSLYGSLFGAENIGNIGVLDLGHEFFVWFVLSSLLLVYQKAVIQKDLSPNDSSNLKKPQTKAYLLMAGLKNFLSSPVIIAILLGLICNFIGLRDFIINNDYIAGLTESLSLLSQLTIPLILIILGYQINFKFSQMKLPILTIVLRYSLTLSLALLIDIILLRRLLNLAREFSVALYLMFILPPPFIIPLFTQAEDKVTNDYIANSLSLGTLVSLIGFSVIAVVSAL